MSADQLPPSRIAGGAAAPVVGLWTRLARPTSGAASFDPSTVGDVPEAGRRWLTHAIAPGARLGRTVVLEMQGSFRLGRWLPARAVQVLSPPDGLVWAARIGWGPLSLRGFDRFGDGAGEMQWQLLGVIPIAHMDGRDVDRSAAGRLAGEAIWVPPAFLGRQVTWREGTDPDTVTAEWSIGPHVVSTNLRVGEEGELRSVTIRRWGNPTGHPWGEYPFGGSVVEEASFDGITIPTRMTVGWHYGTDRAAEGEFYKIEVTGAQFL